MKNIIFKIVHILNIPAHIKRFYLRLKLKKHKMKTKKIDDEEENSSSGTGIFSLKFLNLIILIFLLTGLIYMNFIYRDRYFIVGSIIMIIIILAAARIIFIKKREHDRCQIEKIILQDENEEQIKKWDISRSVSLLIGKETGNNEVDIDLSRAVYSSLVSRRHAVMNRTSGKWYFEDMNSYNGSGILRSNSEDRFKVEGGKAYQVYSGDVIYIANTKLILK